MGITKGIREAFKVAKNRNWDKIYIAFDVHGTIIVPNYKVGDIPKRFYPKSKNQRILKRKLLRKTNG